MLRYETANKKNFNKNRSCFAALRYETAKKTLTKTRAVSLRFATKANNSCFAALRYETAKQTLTKTRAAICMHKNNSQFICKNKYKSFVMLPHYSHPRQPIASHVQEGKQ